MDRLNYNKIKAQMNRLATSQLAWLWLLVGFLFLPFTFWQTVIPLAAWLAPVFLLRFVRTTSRPRLALPLVFLAYAVSIWISLRSAGTAASLIENLIYLFLFEGVKGFMFTLPYAADRWIGSRLGKWGRILVFPLAFTGADWAMSRIVLVMNTGSPAYTQYGFLPLVQIISITGMWGLTFLIAWFASTVNALWECHFDLRSVRSQLGVFAGVLAVVLVFGSLRLSLLAPASQSIKAATITIDSAVSKAASSPVDWLTFNQSTNAERAAARPGFEATVDQMLSRTETALRGGAKIVGWQEGSALVLEEDKQSVMQRVSALAKQYNTYIQVGLWVSTRTPSREFVRNQSILVDNTGRVLWTYDKTHPVFLDEAYIMIRGSGQLPLVSTTYGRMSTAICNDLHFPSLIRQAGQNHTDIFMAPYGSIPAFEHEDFVVAVYRTVENGFSLIRPTSNGLSAVVDPEGRLLSSADYYKNSSGIMFASLPLHGVTTIYSRIGDLFAYLCVAGLACLAVLAFLRRKQPVQVVAGQPALA